MQISQADVDTFSGSSELPCCPVMVEPTSEQVKTLNYLVSIENIQGGKSILIHCSYKQFSTGNLYCQHSYIYASSITKLILLFMLQIRLSKLE